MSWLVVAVFTPAHGFGGVGDACGPVPSLKAATVVIARDGDHTVLTLSASYLGKGPFALLVPVPGDEQPSVSYGDQASIEALDHFTQPRLERVADPSPCGSLGQTLSEGFLATIVPPRGVPPRILMAAAAEPVGQVLSASNARQLRRRVARQGYHVPASADSALDFYVAAGMSFVLVKAGVLSAEGSTASHPVQPHPVQLRYRSKAFDLPIALMGLDGADDPHDVTLITLTPNGRVEVANLQNRRIPGDVGLPALLAAPGRFRSFTDTLFDRQTTAEQEAVAYQVFAGPVGSLASSLSSLGTPALTADGTFVTRIALRVDQNAGTELVLRGTLDRSEWQTRFFVHEPFPLGPLECPNEREAYLNDVAERDARANWVIETLTGERWQ